MVRALDDEPTSLARLSADMGKPKKVEDLGLLSPRRFRSPLRGARIQSGVSCPGVVLTEFLQRSFHPGETARIARCSNPTTASSRNERHQSPIA